MLSYVVFLFCFLLSFFAKPWSGVFFTYRRVENFFGSQELHADLTVFNFMAVFFSVLHTVGSMSIQWVLGPFSLMWFFITPGSMQPLACKNKLIWDGILSQLSRFFLISCVYLQQQYTGLCKIFRNYTCLVVQTLSVIYTGICCVKVCI